MIATHRVKDTENNTVGFMVNNGFYTEDYIKNNIKYLNNLTLLKNGIIRAKKELPEIQYKKAVIKRKYIELVRDNPYKRDVQEELLAWKNNKLHKVLQLEGTRQIGKTTELLKFAYKNYEYVINVNLANDIYNFLQVIQNGCRVFEFEKYCMRAGLPHFVNKKSTIIILDEIQISEQVYNSIRRLFDEINCDIIVTGSYLGQTIKENYFLPSGTISYIHMYGLSFAEFCRIFDEEKLLYKIDLYGKDTDENYDKLFRLYELYRKIGGYPEVIKRYISTKNIGACYEVIADLLETFRNESRNYFKSAKESIIFETVYREAMKIMCTEKKGSGKDLIETVTQLAKASQKMIISRDEVSNAISWLVYSGIIGECRIYNEGKITQLIEARRIYYMDCGIASFIGSQLEIDESNIIGTITEIFVYTELQKLYTKRYTKKLVKGNTPCFSTKGIYELDFMIVDKNNIRYGIEAKTDTGDPKSLKEYLTKKLLDKGIVAKVTKGGHGEQFDTIPIFAVGCRFPYN